MRLGTIALWSTALAPTVVLGVLLSGLVGDAVLAAPMFHFYVVSFGSLIGFVITFLLLYAASQVRDSRVVFLGLAYLGIAGISIVHGLTTPGALVPGSNPWVGLSSRLSLFVGAVFYALSTIDRERPVHRWVVRHQARLILGFIVALVIFGVVAVLSSLGGSPTSSAGAAYGYSGTPSSGVFSGALDLLATPLLNWSFALVTLGLLVAAVARYGWLYRLSRMPFAGGLLLSSALFAQAELSMVVGPVWHVSWWEYHVLLIAAFAVAIYGLVLEYGQTGSIRGVIEGVLLRDTILQLQRGYADVIVALIEAVEAKDPYTRGHTQRVAEHAIKIGQRLRLPPERLRVLNQSALLHDIGKIGISDAILNKPGRLTAEEFEIVKAHPVRGHAIIAGIRALQEEIPGVRSHHERLDGSGYPDGLAGDAVPMDARIIAVADEYDALTSSRSYRPAWSPERAFAVLDEEARTKLDSRCVDALREILLAEGVLAPSDSCTSDQPVAAVSSSI